MDGNEIKPLIKSPGLVVSLEIVDHNGKSADKKYVLNSGSNEFSCRATYVDGSTAIFEAYWTCPIILNGGGADFYGTLGKEKQKTVNINASANHTRYTELACWVKFPDGANTDAGQYPHASIGFDYSNIVNT